METNEPTSPEPAAPPSEVGELPEKPPSWPTVFGVINIVLASLGLLGGCCALGYPLVMPPIANWMRSNNTPEEQVRLFEASQPPVVWTVFAGLVGLVLAIVLLTGSIKLIRRVEGGVKLCRVWAWISIPWTVLGFLVNIVIQLQLPQDIKDLQAQSSGGQYLGLAIGACFAIVIGVGYPLFMLLWFARDRSRAEIERWATESRTVI